MAQFCNGGDNILSFLEGHLAEGKIVLKKFAVFDRSARASLDKRTRELDVGNGLLGFVDA